MASVLLQEDIVISLPMSLTTISFHCQFTLYIARLSYLTLSTYPCIISGALIKYVVETVVRMLNGNPEQIIQ